MDEFHFYSEPDRGWAWQVPLLELAKTQFVLMSATLGDVTPFQRDLTRRTGRTTAVVTSAQRPVPLSYSWALTPLHETLEELLTTHQAPVYVVHFTQAAALERAQSLMSINVCTRAEKDEIAALIGGFRFSAGFGKTLSRLVRHGIGVHHAGMLPKYRRLVEQLAQAGLLKVICGTDTLGVGINVPIRTVVLTGLTKFDGARQRLLKAREFHQIAGRAGRAGFDTSGSVVVQAPEHVIENHRAVLKAGDDPKKQRKVQRKKAPEGFVTWTEEHVRAARGGRARDAGLPDAGQPRDAAECACPRGRSVRGDAGLLRDNHEDPRRQARLSRRAIQIYRSLLTAGVVERLDAPDADGRLVRLVEDLQFGFALNQPLSPFALAAFSVLDAEAPTYALDVVSVVESTLDDPRQVLMAQQFKARGEAVAEMKAEGIEYDERMELLDDVGWPKPLQELLEAVFETYRQGHPWVARTPLSPKSVVRDMFERAMTFGEFVAYYGLSRSEGLVLRYLSDAYKALRQTVPDAAKTEELSDLIEWLGEVVRQTDSSLLDEWEQLSDPARAARGRGPSPSAAGRSPATTGLSACWCETRCSAGWSWPRCGGGTSSASSMPRPGWDAERWREAIDDYFAEYDSIGTGATRAARRCCRSRASRAAGWCARSSTTPRATTTGRSPRRSTSRPRTTPVRRSWRLPGSARPDVTGRSRCGGRAGAPGPVGIAPGPCRLREAWPRHSSTRSPFVDHRPQPGLGVADVPVLRRRTGSPTTGTSCTWARSRRGGAGLVFTEATAVVPEGRISPAGRRHLERRAAQAWARIVDFLHGQGAVGGHPARARRPQGVLAAAVGRPRPGRRRGRRLASRSGPSACRSRACATRAR